MQTIHYLMMAQGLFALTVAFFITRKLRNFIRASVVRLMPVRHRISDASFNLQTRISTLTAYFIGLTLTGLIYWGMDELVAAIAPTAVTQAEMTTVRPLPLAPIPPKAPTPEPVVAPEAAAAPAPPSRTESADGTPQRERPPAPVSYQDVGGHYYLQLYAFDSADRAIAQQTRYGRQLSRPVLIVKIDGDIGPYKVVAGPFRSRREVQEFQRQAGLEGQIVSGGRLGL